MKKTFVMFGLVAGFSVSAMAADFNGYVIDHLPCWSPTMGRFINSPIKPRRFHWLAKRLRFQAS
jgi:hypothetical protein